MARQTLVFSLILATAGALPAQHSYDHPAPRPQPVSRLSPAPSNWKSEAMARHMAYSASRQLTRADSARADHVINELRQAVARY